MGDKGNTEFPPELNVVTLTPLIKDAGKFEDNRRVKLMLIAVNDQSMVY